MRYLKAELLVLAGVLALAVVFGLQGVLADSASKQDYAVIGGDLEPFRTAFNQASDHVRAVLLVGPT